MIDSSKTPAIFLDRDGVLNEPVVRDGNPYPPRTAAEMKFAAGAKEACETLSQLGVPLVCVTNQPDIARGSVTENEVNVINAKLIERLGLTAVMVCPHDDSTGCNCRKPKPGMILDAANQYGVDLSRSVLVGDRWRDIEAGLQAGCRTVFIDHGYREQQPSGYDYTAASLVDAVPWIVEFIGSSRTERETPNA